MNVTKGFQCLLWTVAIVLAAGGARVQAIEFDFKDPKGINTMVFILDSPLEPIMGLAKSISGSVQFDSAQPEKMTGTIKVDAKSVETSNKRMASVLRSKDWLNTQEFQSIEFAIKNVTVDSKPERNTYDLTMTGDFTCHGVTKELSIPVEVVFQPNKLSDRMRGKKGDLLLFRSEFFINRKDFGIKVDAPAAVVANEIQIRVSIIGSHFK